MSFKVALKFATKSLDLALNMMCTVVVTHTRPVGIRWAMWVWFFKKGTKRVTKFERLVSLELFVKIWMLKVA